MRKFSTIRTLLVLLFFGSVSNLQAQWDPTYFIGPTASPARTCPGTGTNRVTSDTCEMTFSVDVYNPGSGESDTRNAGDQATDVSCTFYYRNNLYGSFTSVAMAYEGNGSSTNNDRYRTPIGASVLKLKPDQYTYYFACTIAGDTKYGNDSNKNYYYDLFQLNPSSIPTVCEYSQQWDHHKTYGWRTEFTNFAGGSSWFSNEIARTVPTIQGDHNYAQVTVQATDADDNHVFGRKISTHEPANPTDLPDRWSNASFGLDTPLTAYIGTSGSADNLITGGAEIGKYYTMRFRRTDGAGASSDPSPGANREFAILKTTNPPVRILTVDAVAPGGYLSGGTPVGSVDLGADAHAKAELWDRSTKCNTGSTDPLYNGNNAFNDGNAADPYIAKQDVSVTGTLSAAPGADQHVYVRVLEFTTSTGKKGKDNKTSAQNYDRIIPCTETGTNYSCTIPKGEMGNNLFYMWYVFTSSVDFTTTTASAVSHPANANGAYTVTSENNLDLVSIDYINYQTAYGDYFRRTPSRNFLFGVNNQTLPIALTSLTAAVSANRADLQWSTATETDNAGFYVEHRLPSGQWKQLGFVAGNGTSTVAHTYSYPVKDMPYGYNTFRLKQVDSNGIGKYSNEITVLVELPGTALLSSAYPNPFSHTATIEFAVAATQNVKVEVFNVLGQRVQTLFDGTLEGNTVTSAKLDATGLSNGTYVVRMTGASFVKTENVVLVK